MKMLCVLLLGLCGLLFVNMQALADVVPLDKIVVVINNDVITSSEVNKQMNLIKKQMPASANMDAATLRKKVIDSLIDENLILQLAKRNNVTVSDQQLNTVLKNIAAQNNLTEDQLKGAVQQQGMNYDDYLKQIRKQILMNEVQQRAVGGTVMVTDADVQALMRQNSGQSSAYHLIDLLLPLSDNATPAEINAAQKQATQLLTQLQQNATVQKPEGSAWQMIDLGWRTPSAMPDLFAAQVVKMKLNDSAGPLRAPNGFHIIKLVGIKGQQAITKEQARQLVYQKKLMEKVKPWLEHLRNTAYIKVMD